MSAEFELTVRPVGWVREGASRPGGETGLEARASEIEIDAAWAEALDGIEGFSHVWVVWCFDQAGVPPAALRVHPEQRAEMPLVGIFATRSPHRPNGLAITAVRLLGRQGARLRVQGLEATQGTPVLDIKPYLRRGDLIAEASAPDWLERLWEVHDRERAGLEE
jgi:tRNA-Thr(GGU) m(6)t(6)A37 methyltransferase TsaA